MRLNLLRALFAEREASVAVLALETGILESIASTQLRLLNSRGLISARPEGRWVFYSTAPNPSVEHASAILKSIRKCCGTGMENEDLIKMATAFTHQRRIAIAKQLSQRACTFPELSLKAQISAPALYRHLGKLMDRNMVKMEKDRYLLKSPRNPFGRTLLEIVAR